VATRLLDDVFIAIFNASQKLLRFLVQDLDPMNKSLTWPKNYYEAWTKAIYERDVNVKIVLSNPSTAEERDPFSNVWSCEEIAAETIKTMEAQYANTSDEELTSKLKKNLRVCFMKSTTGNT